MKFKLVSDYSPKGDQGSAIKELVDGINREDRHQTLLGVTGSGKTFTMANVIERIQMPTLVISHNKTLAAQLYDEFKEFFPENAVEYFVSFYDYYQPEAYIPSSDTYIEKSSEINDEIDRLRLKATSSLMSRRDVIIVASVSCIYNIGSPDTYAESSFSIAQGDILHRDEFFRQLIAMQYTRNDTAFERGRYRVRGDTIGSMELSFEPGPAKCGSYHFAVGTAGSGTPNGDFHDQRSGSYWCDERSESPWADSGTRPISHWIRRCADEPAPQPGVDYDATTDSANFGNFNRDVV